MIRKNLFGGYPYGEPKTKETLPSRVGAGIDEGNVRLFVDLTQFPDFHKIKGIEEEREFVLNRVYELTNALESAEQQIMDLQAEYPFIAQDFGFEETEERMGDDSGFMPTCYKKGKYLLARIPGTDHDWFISGIGKVFIPNTEWAYIIFRSLGIITEEEVAEEVIISGETIKDIEN